MRVVFTDLDGSLLGEQTYSYDAALPALEALQADRIPLVLATSKTRAEVEFFRKQLGNGHPFIVENGGALFIPDGYFPFQVASSRSIDGYEVVELGYPYKFLIEALAMASLESGCKVRGFSEWNPGQISRRCGLPLEMAVLAKQREYDEPFEILSADPIVHSELLNLIEGRGLLWTRGGRFYHICGNNDKAHAVTMLIRYYRKAHARVLTLGLGDGLNDAAFLRLVDQPVVIASPHSEHLHAAVPGARVTVEPGPAGWSRAVLEWLDQTSPVQR